ncbi:MAG TPA: hypothetical protein ENG10_03750 [Candidatus Bathyarchaeota archaeon]|nr:hypothetical protein [Candidatus Bathyarchaeota archaeon]HEX69391.1 hypothetical protein [Candidatus Bathyarchaeota archaeon]
MVIGFLLGALLGSYILGTAAKSAYDAMKSGQMEKDLQQDPFSWGLVGQLYLLKKEIDKLSQSISIEPAEEYVKPQYEHSITPYQTTTSYTKPANVQTYSWRSYKSENFRAKQTTSDPLEEQIKKLVRS